MLKITKVKDEEEVERAMVRLLKKNDLQIDFEQQIIPK